MGVTSRIALLMLCSYALSAPLANALADGPKTRIVDGQTLLVRHCSKCHAIGKIGQSTMLQAPPLRDIYRQYPLERLVFELSEGIGSTHPKMPQIQFSTEQVEKILDYLHGLTGAD